MQQSHFCHTVKTSKNANWNLRSILLRKDASVAEPVTCPRADGLRLTVWTWNAWPVSSFGNPWTSISTMCQSATLQCTSTVSYNWVTHCTVHVYDILPTHPLQPTDGYCFLTMLVSSTKGTKYKYVHWGASTSTSSTYNKCINLCGLH